MKNFINFLLNILLGNKKNIAKKTGMKLLEEGDSFARTAIEIYKKAGEKLTEEKVINESIIEQNKMNSKNQIHGSQERISQCIKEEEKFQKEISITLQETNKIANEEIEEIGTGIKRAKEICANLSNLFVLPKDIK